MPKIVSKSVHTCFEHALGRFFRIFFAECSMQGFSVFLDLKMWVQFYDTLLNRHSFFIHATVNKRNSTSDILDLKLWVQNPELKNMISVFRTWKTWVQFSGLKLCGRDLEKIKEKKSKKISKFQKRPKTFPFPSVQTCFGANFSKKFFCAVFRRFIESFRKN